MHSPSSTTANTAWQLALCPVVAVLTPKDRPSYHDARWTENFRDCNRLSHHLHLNCCHKSLQNLQSCSPVRCSQSLLWVSYIVLSLSYLIIIEHNLFNNHFLVPNDIDSLLRS